MQELHPEFSVSLYKLGPEKRAKVFTPKKTQTTHTHWGPNIFDLTITRQHQGGGFYKIKGDSPILKITRR